MAEVGGHIRWWLGMRGWRRNVYRRRRRLQLQQGRR